MPKQQPGTASIEQLKALKNEVEQLTVTAKKGNPFTLKDTLKALADKQNEFMTEVVNVFESIISEGTNHASTEKRQ